MKTIHLAILILIVSPFFVSCKTEQKISITVIDKVTSLPIDSVLVVVTDGKKSYGGDSRSNSVTGYTNSSGKFEASLQIGFAFGLNQIYLEYDKEGYVHKVECNKPEGIVALEK